MSSKIYSVTSREILDSRGNPTVETTVILESGYRGTASVPAGASKGSNEAVELRDGDKNRYNGYGVLTAVKNVNTVINDKLRGMDALNQEIIDRTMLNADGTPNKSKLGANAILSVSLATAVASANHQRLPLYIYLNQIFNRKFPTKIERIPTPNFNIINGGLHGSGNLNFQEFHIIPATSKTFHEALEMGVVIYYAAKQILTYRNAIHSVGDEGGFAPNLSSTRQALELVLEAIRAAGYRPGDQVALALDVAASELWEPAGESHGGTAAGAGRYVFRKSGEPARTSGEMIELYGEWLRQYPIVSIEDGLGEMDWSGWRAMTAELGSLTQLVGDDIFVTNPAVVRKGIEEGVANALLVKPNQIGTISETLDALALARSAGYRTVISHRSGETEDTFIADLAVATNAGQIKTGAGSRTDRIGKYNQLLRVEEELGEKARFAGQQAPAR